MPAFTPWRGGDNDRVAVAGLVVELAPRPARGRARPGYEDRGAVAHHGMAAVLRRCGHARCIGRGRTWPTPPGWLASRLTLVPRPWSSLSRPSGTGSTATAIGLAAVPSARTRGSWGTAITWEMLAADIPRRLLLPAAPAAALARQPQSGQRSRSRLPGATEATGSRASSARPDGLAMAAPLADLPLTT